MNYKQVKNVLKRAGFNVSRKLEIYDNGDGYDVYTIDYDSNIVLIEFTYSIKLKNVTIIF